MAMKGIRTQTLSTPVVGPVPLLVAATACWGVGTVLTGDVRHLDPVVRGHIRLLAAGAAGRPVVGATGGGEAQRQGEQGDAEANRHHRRP